MVGIRFFAVLFLAFLVVGCTVEKRTFRKVEGFVSKKEHRKALVLLDRLIDSTQDNTIKLKAAQRGVLIAERYTKDYRSRIQFLRVNVLHGDHDLRQKSQKQIADVYFHQLSNYPQAVVEYNRLLALNPKDTEARLYLAKANYYLGQFEQALVELDYVASRSEEMDFEVSFLRGQPAGSHPKMGGGDTPVRNLAEKVPQKKRKRWP